MEFYANAWPTEEGAQDMRSWVRGQWIPFDADALNQFLGHPLILEEGQQCEFSQRKSQPEVLTRRPLLSFCAYRGRILPGSLQGDRWGSCALAWPPWPIYGWRCCSATSYPMTTTPISLYRSVSWCMPSWHRWVFTWLSWLLTPFISLQERRLWGTLWTRKSPIGPWVSPLWSWVIRPPITRAFIEKYCTSWQAQGEAPQQPRDAQPQAADAPPSPPESTSAHLRRLESYIQHVADQ